MLEADENRMPVIATAAWTGCRSKQRDRVGLGERYGPALKADKQINDWALLTKLAQPQSAGL